MVNRQHQPATRTPPPSNLPPNPKISNLPDSTTRRCKWPSKMSVSLVKTDAVEVSLLHELEAFADHDKHEAL